MTQLKASLEANVVPWSLGEIFHFQWRDFFQQVPLLQVSSEMLHQTLCAIIQQQMKDHTALCFPMVLTKISKKKTWNEDEPSEEINNRWRVASRCSEYCPTRKASSWSSGLLHSSPERGYPKAYASEILNRRNRFRCINIPLITYDKNSLQKFFSYRKFVYDNVCNLFL